MGHISKFFHINDAICDTKASSILLKRKKKYLNIQIGWNLIKNYIDAFLESIWVVCLIKRIDWKKYTSANDIFTFYISPMLIPTLNYSFLHLSLIPKMQQNVILVSYLWQNCLLLPITQLKCIKLLLVGNRFTYKF